MSAVDSGYYEQQRRGIEDQYAAQMASNTFSRTLGQQRGERNLSFMTQSFKREVPRFSAGFAQRGLGGGQQSGVMRRSMSNYLGDFNTQYGEAQTDLYDQLRQFDLQGAQLGANRSASLAEMELAKAREIAYTAQNIAALRQMMGGT